MKKLAIFTAALAITGGAYAADFNRLLSVTSDDLKAEAAWNAETVTPVPFSAGTNVSPYGAAMGEPSDIRASDAASESSFIKGAMPPGRDLFRAQEKDADQETQYDMVKKLFERGRPATKEELTGWYSGRYVCVKYPDILWGSIMVGTEIASPGGPAFPSSLWITLPKTRKDPAYYDVLTPVKIRAIKNAMPLHGLVLSFPSATGTYTYTNGLSSIIYHMEYRVAGGYIIEKMGDKQVGAGYTYYFKKVTP